MYVVKTLIVLFSTVSGYIFFKSFHLEGYSPLMGVFLGFLLGIITIILRDVIAKLQIKYLIAGFIGFGIAISPLYFFTAYLNNPAFSIEILGYTLGLRFILAILLGYIGISVAIEKVRNINIPILDDKKKEEKPRIPKILDTSVLIDGRITDIVESGFLEGPFIIPQFVIKELQTLADSQDATKRNKGRRGLDVISKLQKITNEIELLDIDFFRIKEVDLKLIALAKKLNGKIISIDYNLSKVAELQGINCLNLNILANALKPSLIAGETLSVFVLKEGKEAGQGVAYLDDGTMIVIEDGKKYIGQKIDVEVKSVLQTSSGRIIFTHVI